MVLLKPRLFPKETLVLLFWFGGLGVRVGGPKRAFVDLGPKGLSVFVCQERRSSRFEANEERGLEIETSRGEDGGIMGVIAGVVTADSRAHREGRAA